MLYKMKHLLSVVMALITGFMPALAADYNMESGNGHSITVTDNFFIYDDGGPSGYATPGYEGSVTLIPGSPDKAIKVNAVEFAISGNKVFLYNGREIDETKILGNEKGYFVGNGPKDIVSEAEDGSLTLRFGGSKIGKGVSGTKIAGFKIEVSLADKPKAQTEPLNGTYRVGPSADARFRNLTELQKAFAQGIGGPVVIELEDNNYAEALLIKDISGLSEQNTLTIASVEGKPDNCIISGPVTPLDNTGILCIDNSPYVTVKNITVATNEGNGSRYPYAGLHFRNGSHNATVTGCILKSPQSVINDNDNRTFVALISGCNNVTVSNNRVEGGYCGIYAGVDPETSEGEASTGIVIENNDITNVSLSSIRVHTCDAFRIAGNTITPGSKARKSANHIDIWKPSGNFALTGNKLLIEQSADFTAINLRSGSGSADAQSPALIGNNVIACTNIANAYTTGIFVDVSNKNLLVAQNSINMAAANKTVTSLYGIAFNGNASESAGAPHIFNNIISSENAGVPLRPWNDSHYKYISFGHNVYYSPTDLIDSDKQTFAQYQEATGDKTSVWAKPDFMSKSDLRLADIDRSFFMPRLDAVTTDFNGGERSNPTAAGAYEYQMPAPDAPVIADGYPQVGTPDEHGVTVKTKWSETGSLYFKALPATADSPSPETLKALTPTAIDADKEIITTIGGLQPSTDYRVYFLAVSSLGAESAVVPTGTFTTTEAIQPLTALIFWQDEPFEAGETVELEAYVEGGKEPYTYKWTDQQGEVVSTTESYSYTALKSLTFHLSVTSADGQSVICKDNIPVVTGDLIKGTFDDLYLAPESSWTYDKSMPDNGGYYTDSFYSGSFEFTNMSMTSYNYWCGYGYSNETSTEFKTLADQMHNAVGGGADGTAAYGVCYAYGAPTAISLSVPETGTVVPGIYITNSAYFLNSIVNGDGYAKPFADGDWQSVVIEGQLDDNSTGKVSVSLAEFADGSLTALTDWQWVDLAQLGKVTSLIFTLEGSNTETIPAYFCLDEIGAVGQQNALASAGADGDSRTISLVTPDCIAVAGAEGSYDLRIYSVDGTCRATFAMNGPGAVSIADLPAGIYIATAEGANALRFAR